MKIKKLVEEAEKDDVVLSDTPSVDDIKDAVKAASDTDITTANAKQIQKEVEKTADDLNTDKVVVAPSKAASPKEFYEAKNAMIDILNLALQATRRYQRQAKYGKAWAPEGVNVLITGLPGSGKTSIVKQWAVNRGLNLIECNAKDAGITELIYGIKVPDKNEKGKTIIHEVRPENFLKKLHEPNSVLFLDEFNRQTDMEIRASLYDLINKKEINTGSGEKHDFNDSLLFVVACINPSIESDIGATPLSDAEKSRFVLKGTFNSNPEAADSYNSYLAITKLTELGLVSPAVQAALEKKLGLVKVKLPNDPTAGMTDDEKKAYYQDLDKKEVARIWAIGKKLYNNPRFTFDTESDNYALSSENKTQLNTRSLQQGLQLSGGDLNTFFSWLDSQSDYLDKDISMIKSILRGYNPDTDAQALLKLLGGAQQAVANDNVAKDKNGKKKDAEEVNLNPNNEDDDDAIFGGPTSGTGKQSAAAMANIIAGIVNSWAN